MLDDVNLVPAPDRLMPVGSCGRAETILGDMSVETGHDNAVGDVACGGREVTLVPEALTAVALADVFELPLDLARRAPLGPSALLKRRVVVSEMLVIAVPD